MAGKGLFLVLSVASLNRVKLILVFVLVLLSFVGSCTVRAWV